MIEDCVTPKSAESEEPRVKKMGRLRAFFHSLGHACLIFLDDVYLVGAVLMLCLPFAVWAGLAQDNWIMLIPATLPSLLVGMTTCFYLKEINSHGGYCQDCLARKRRYRRPGPV